MCGECCSLVQTYRQTRLLYSIVYKYKNEVGCRDDTVPKQVTQEGTAR